MVDWIRADDSTREWPEGEVVVFGRSNVGRPLQLITYRDADGKLRDAECDEISIASADITHFFYLPDDPA